MTVNAPPGRRRRFISAYGLDREREILWTIEFLVEQHAELLTQFIFEERTGLRPLQIIEG